MRSRRIGTGLGAIVFALALTLAGPVMAFALQPGTSIHGVVTNAKTGLPILGATVSAYSPETYESISTSTDASGLYELATGVGTYDVSCYVSDRYEYETAYSVAADPLSPAPVNFSVTPYDKAFFGVVTDADTGLPIPSAAVVVESESGPFSTVVHANALGVYEVYAPAGTYEVGFAAAGYRRHVMTGQVFSGTAVELNGSLALLVTSVFGTVTNSSGGDAVPNAMVTLSWTVPDPQPGDPDNVELFEISTSTDANGAYKFTTEHVGTYQVRAASYGFVPSARQDAVFDGSHPVQRDFALEPKPEGTSISGIPAGWSASNVTFTLSAIEWAGAGVVGTYYRLGDAGDVLEYTEPVTITDEGVTTLTYWSVDADSNRESDKTATIRIDKTAPVTTSNAVPTYSGSAAITLAPGDAGGSALKVTKWRLDGAASWTNGTSVSTLAVGSHTLEFYSEDNAGNSESVNSVSFAVSASPLASTSLSIQASATAPKTYGQTVNLTGVLRQGSGSGVPSASVAVQKYSSGAWMTVGAVWTAADGSFAWAVKPTSATTYRFAFAGATGFAAAGSASVKVVPKAYLTKVATSRYGSRAYRLTGTLKPKHKAGTYPVRIYRWKKVSGKWKSMGYGKAKASDYKGNTRFTVKYKFPSKGAWRLQAVAPADSSHQTSKSAYTYFTVK